MKELWSKTAKLVLNYPILWLPYICAHLLNTSLGWLRHAVVAGITPWLTTTTRRSVLVGVPIQIHSDTASTKIVWISGALRWSFRYITLCIEITALVVIAALVVMIVRGEQPRFRAALTELRSYPKRILGYSFKLYFLVLTFATFVSFPVLRLWHWVTYSSAMTTSWSRVADFALVQGQVCVSIILFAWIMTPIEIRLLRAPDAEPPSAEEKKLGRYFVVLTGIGVWALRTAFTPLSLKLITLPQFPEQVYAWLTSLVLSFPYLMGEIGVALIATGGELNLDEIIVYRKWRQLARVLMPLHVDKREEV
jgi:hypothetical protein